MDKFEVNHGDVFISYTERGTVAFGFVDGITETGFSIDVVNGGYRLYFRKMNNDMYKFPKKNYNDILEKFKSDYLKESMSSLDESVKNHRSKLEKDFSDDEIPL